MSFSTALIAEDSDSQVEENGRVVSNYRRTIQYKTDSATRPTESAIVADVGIVPGSPYPNDFRATARQVSIGPGPEMTKPPHLCYHVKIEWSTKSPVPNTVDTDPTTMRTVWSLGTTIQQRYIVKDRNGVMILNSAGQPFDGGIPVAVRLGTAVAKKNRSAVGYNKDAVLANSGKLNSVVYLGGAIGTVQVDISSEERFEGDYHYWAEVYSFAYDPLGWQPKPMDAGFFQRGDYDQLLRILNADVGDTNDPTAPVQEPEPLLEDGRIVPIVDRPGDCRFVEVDAYDSLDFTSLGL